MDLLVRVLHTALPVLFSWKVGQLRSTIVPNDTPPPMLAIPDVETYMLPPIVDISAGGSSSSSSMAVVPLESVDVPLALAQLHDYKAHMEPIDINRIRNVNMEHIRALEARGVVSTTEAEDGGCQIVVIPSAVEVVSLVRLQEPCQVSRSLSSVVPTTLPKLYYCARLVLCY